MKAQEILRELVREVRDPDISNGPAAMRACIEAEKLFKEEEDALQKRSPAAEISRASGAGKNEAGSAPPVGKRNPQGKIAGKAHSTVPGGEAQKT